jgi:hypothetical protein
MARQRCPAASSSQAPAICSMSATLKKLLGGRLISSVAT